MLSSCNPPAKSDIHFLDLSIPLRHGHCLRSHPSKCARTYGNTGMTAALMKASKRMLNEGYTGKSWEIQSLTFRHFRFQALDIIDIQTCHICSLFSSLGCVVPEVVQEGPVWSSCSSHASGIKSRPDSGTQVEVSLCDWPFAMGGGRPPPSCQFPEVSAISLNQIWPHMEKWEIRVSMCFAGPSFPASIHEQATSPTRSHAPKYCRWVSVKEEHRRCLSWLIFCKAQLEPHFRTIPYVHLKRNVWWSKDAFETLPSKSWDLSHQRPSPGDTRMSGIMDLFKLTIGPFQWILTSFSPFNLFLEAFTMIRIIFLIQKTCSGGRPIGCCRWSSWKPSGLRSVARGIPSGWSLGRKAIKRRELPRPDKNDRFCKVFLVILDFYNKNTY